MRSISTISTGDWGILGDDRIRHWPSETGDKRPLKVDISSWVGISAGAKHVKVIVAEAENEWWCENENAWVRIYTDTESGGYEMTANVLTNEEAISTTRLWRASIPCCRFTRKGMMMGGDE